MPHRADHAIAPERAPTAGSAAAAPAQRTWSATGLQVPPRFADATFDSYRPDSEHPSQQAARDLLQRAMDALNQQHSGGNGLLRRLRRGFAGGGGGGGNDTSLNWQALYLDGRFGVGKTHLLAACWHAATVEKIYLTFQELTYAVGAHGMQGAINQLGTARLICLDEFELDDPGNTMLATSFVRGAIERGARLVITSNTLPGELGKGRFSAEEFQREIGHLATVFTSIRIDGDDYRQRHFNAADQLPRLLPDDQLRERYDTTDWTALLARLALTPPLEYPRLIQEFTQLALSQIRPIPDQDTALRVVHFIDKAYDLVLPIVASSEAGLDELFPSSYGYGGFERKFLRCRSRMYEMLSQPLSQGRGIDLRDDERTVVEVHHAARQ